MGLEKSDYTSRKGIGNNGKTAPEPSRFFLDRTTTRARSCTSSLGVVKSGFGCCADAIYGCIRAASGRGRVVVLYGSFLQDGIQHYATLKLRVWNENNCAMVDYCTLLLQR